MKKVQAIITAEISVEGSEKVTKKVIDSLERELANALNSKVKFSVVNKAINGAMPGDFEFAKVPVEIEENRITIKGYIV